MRNDHIALRWAFFTAKAEGRLAKWRLRLAEFDFDVVYRPGIKHTVLEVLLRVSTNGADKTDLKDEIPCFILDDSEEDLEWSASYDDMPDELLLHPAEDLETVRDEEWRREQGRDPLCSEIKQTLTSEKSTSFAVNEKGILARQALLEGATQIVVPPTLKRLSHSPPM